MERLLESATRPRVKDFLSVEIRRLQTEISQERAKGENVESTKANNDTPVQKSYAPYDVQVKNYCKYHKLELTSSFLSYQPLLNILSAWDQSDKFVKIYLTGLSGASSLPENSVVTKFGAKSVDVRVENLNGKNHCLSIKETAENILPEKSYYKIKTGGSVRFVSLLCEISRFSIYAGLSLLQKYNFSFRHGPADVVQG